MTAASALLSGPLASCQLVEQAVAEALARAGMSRAESLVLLLTEEYAHNYPEAVISAARAAGCLSVFGSLCRGLFNETEWVLDQPAVAVMALSHPMANGRHLPGNVPVLSLAATPALPAGWPAGQPRIGLLNSQLPLWSGGRPSRAPHIEFTPGGMNCHVAVSSGLLALGTADRIGDTRDLEIVRIGHLSAVEHLKRHLPADLRARNPLPLHALAALRDGDAGSLPLLSINGDGSITLAEALPPGTPLRWAIRQPMSAAREMHDSLLASSCRHPEFALMLSCIGRGPLFYDGDDLDVASFRTLYPGVPLLGTYGNAQIAPLNGTNRLLYNSVVTALYEPSEPAHV